MTKCNKWEIWDAEVKFEDIEGKKKRPVLIVAEKEAYILSLKMTSHDARRKCEGEYEMMDWERAGLKEKTVIRCSKKLELQESDLLIKRGRLQSVDITGVEAMLKYMKMR